MPPQALPELFSSVAPEYAAMLPLVVVAYAVLLPAPTKAHGPRMPLMFEFVVVIDPAVVKKSTVPPAFWVIVPKASVLPAVELLIVAAPAFTVRPPSDCVAAPEGA